MKMIGKNYVKQHDIRDCAAACMTSVCNLYGLNISLLHMRELLKIDKNGSSMYALKEVATKIGFLSDVLQGGCQEFFSEVSMGKICCPIICHMHIDGLEHFVIIKKITNRNIWIFDPAAGHIKYTYELFEACWTGYILSIQLTDTVKKKKRKRKKTF